MGRFNVFVAIFFCLPICDISVRCYRGILSNALQNHRILLKENTTGLGWRGRTLDQKFYLPHCPPTLTSLKFDGRFMISSQHERNCRPTVFLHLKGFTCILPWL